MVVRSDPDEIQASRCRPRVCLPRDVRSVSYPTIVQRAIDVAAASNGERLTVVGLCRAVGVSERTLRTAFHHVHGVSPKQFLIQRRLKEAHDALLRARGAKGAVTRIATQSGFFELGRFAGCYRHVFGVRPSETLRSTVSCGPRTPKMDPCGRSR